MRGMNEQSIALARQELQGAIVEIVAADKITVDVEVLTADTPVPLDVRLAEVTEQVCQEHSIPYQRMNSGAGHDAMHLAKLIPTTMIFVPSVEGISHNPAEYTKPEDLVCGVQVLWDTIRKLDAM